MIEGKDPRERLLVLVDVVAQLNQSLAHPEEFPDAVLVRLEALKRLTDFEMVEQLTADDLAKGVSDLADAAASCGTSAIVQWSTAKGGSINPAVAQICANLKTGTEAFIAYRKDPDKWEQHLVIIETEIRRTAPMISDAGLSAEAIAAHRALMQEIQVAYGAGKAGHGQAVTKMTPHMDTLAAEIAGKCP